MSRVEDDVERTPLLRNASEDSNKRKKEEVPWAALWALWTVNVVPGLAFEIILPFVNQMLLENHVVDDPEKVGYYSGITESLFAVVQVLTVVPFSYLTDIVGRKPVIVLGTFGVSISTACFGMSKTFMGMLLSRSLGGALGGCWAAMRVMTAEIVPKHAQGTAFGGLGITYRLGQIVGLPLGGWLSHPERHLGLTGAFWKEYPFALPCFVGAGFAALASLYGFFALHETLKNPWRPQCIGRKTPSPSRSPTLDGTQEELPKPILPFSAVITPGVLHLLLSSFLTSYLAEILFALYPLFGFTPRPSGGLGLSEAQIGTHMAIRSVAHIVLMMPFSALTRRFGSLRLFQLMTTLWPVVIALFPVAGYYAFIYDDSDNVYVWIAVLAIFIVWSFASLTWMSMSIMMNESAPVPEALARLNALQQLTIVIPQALAPVTGTSLFAFSVETGIFHGNLVWILLFTLACLQSFHAWVFLKEGPIGLQDDRGTLSED